MTFTDAELDAIDAKLSSQIGDDIQVIFNHEGLFKQSRAAITYLRAQRRELAIHIATDEGRVASQIEAAVKAERERCVGIAHQFGEAAFKAMGESPEKKSAALALTQGFAALAIVMGMEPK